MDDDRIEGVEYFSNFDLNRGAIYFWGPNEEFRLTQHRNKQKRTDYKAPQWHGIVVGKEREKFGLSPVYVWKDLL